MYVFHVLLWQINLINFQKSDSAAKLKPPLNVEKTPADSNKSTMVHESTGKAASNVSPRSAAAVTSPARLEMRRVASDNALKVKFQAAQQPLARAMPSGYSAAAPEQARSARASNVSPRRFAADSPDIIKPVIMK